MYIDASDIAQWRKTLLDATEIVTSYRGRISDKDLSKLIFTFQDMAFVIAYTEHQLRIDVDMQVADRHDQIMKQIRERIKATDERLKQTKQEKGQDEKP
jgi:hypothetical protein